MKEIQYKTFSLRTHKKNWPIKRPNVCQFELTFACDLHCKYCYSDCYNKPSLMKKELNTEQVKFILDKVYDAGVIWLCFTGGDPLARDDFLDIYSYVRNKGFVITIFTTGYLMNKKVADYLEKRPPFVIEITLNGVTKENYEEISGVKDSFERVMDGLRMIIDRKIPLKIKTQLIKDNLKESPKIKEFVENLGLEFQPSFDLYPCLNQDSTPCNLRVSPEEVLNLDKRLKIDSMENRTANINLFRCAAGGGDGINLDPYGNMFLCNLIRQPFFNLLEVSIENALNRLLPLARDRKFITESKCKYCKIWDYCHNCPGRALLETGDMEAPVPHYCELAQWTVRRMLHVNRAT